MQWYLKLKLLPTVSTAPFTGQIPYTVFCQIKFIPCQIKFTLRQIRIEDCQKSNCYVNFFHMEQDL